MAVKYGYQVNVKLTFNTRDNEQGCCFSFEKIEAIRNQPESHSYLNAKPYGGLWVSVNNGWERYCLESKYFYDRLNHRRYKVELANWARVLVIENDEDLNLIPETEYCTGELTLSGFSSRGAYPDFEAMAEEYDAIIVPEPMCYYLKDWDLASGIIFNPDAIESVVEIDPIKTTDGYQCWGRKLDKRFSAIRIMEPWKSEIENICPYAWDVFVDDVYGITDLDNEEARAGSEHAMREALEFMSTIMREDIRQYMTMHITPQWAVCFGEYFSIKRIRDLNPDDLIYVDDFGYYCPIEGDLKDQVHAICCYVGHGDPAWQWKKALAFVGYIEVSDLRELPEEWDSWNIQRDWRNRKFNSTVCCGDEYHYITRKAWTAPVMGGWMSYSEV